MANLSFAALALLLTGVASTGLAAGPANTAPLADPLLQHHEIRFEDLPAPFATRSATNPPSMVARPASASLHLPPGFRIDLWAVGFTEPRMMLQAPNGDVLVSEPAAGRIEVLRDADSDGVPEQRFLFASGLNAPFGLAFHAGYLYVGDTDAVVRFRYDPGQTSGGNSEQVASLPAAGYHRTRNLIFNADGSKMYVSVGSDSNDDPNADPHRAAILEMNPDGSGQRIFASGLRNPVGLGWEPLTGSLWTCVNERDGMGDDLVPDYCSDVQDGAFYGWPYAYVGRHEDPNHAGQRPDLVAATTTPSLLVQAHSAVLGLAFYRGTMFPTAYQGRAFVALHGSWNRSKRTGYKIISIQFEGGRPSGGYDDFAAGWMLDENSSQVWGRPVGLLVLGDGSLLISDDGAGVIWRVTYRPPARRRAARGE
jgi:glucose/arabinose dehydrogenase